MKFILRTLAVAATIYLISWLAPNLLEVDDFTVAIIVALVISLINTFVRPIVMFLAIPLRILTLGIITLVINGVFHPTDPTALIAVEIEADQVGTGIPLSVETHHFYRGLSRARSATE